MVKCLTQEHNMLVTVGFEPATHTTIINNATNRILVEEKVISTVIKS